MIHSGMVGTLDDLQSTVDTAVAKLKRHAHEFDSIAVMGTSGLVVGSPIALALGKPLIIVRKESDMHMMCVHSSEVENARRAGRRVLFVDDQVSSGATLARVADAVQRSTAGDVEAVYLTDGDRYQSRPRDYAGMY
jgi:adenine/guanine phosphoribosyltransferase-like PRPP-binding protein